MRLLGLSLLALGAPALAAAPLDDATRQLSHDLFKELIEIDTSHSAGSTTVAAEAMCKHLLDAGYAKDDVVVLGPKDKRGNLVARLRGSGKAKPVLIIGHLDVVEAKREDWTTDPFRFVEKDGYFYGRGTQDMKGGDAVAVTTMMRLKREGFVPDRDIILALTADEEGGMDNGVDWLLKNHRDLVDAEFVLNPDSAGVLSENGKPVDVDVEAAEKLYADYELSAKNPGGHSSLPTKDNAIYQLATALGRLERSPFPFELNPVTRAYVEHMLTVEHGKVAADLKAILGKKPDAKAIARLSKTPFWNSELHTTCVATRLAGGHANNALPQSATANVNCRILPGHSPEEVRKQLVRIVADARVAVKYFDGTTETTLDVAPERKSMVPPPPREDLFDALRRTVAVHFPGVPIVPEMETGASDSFYTMAEGIPSYGVSGIGYDRDDIRAHGKDERLRVGAYYAGVAFWYDFLKNLTGAH